MFRRAAVRIAVPALAGIGLLLVAGPAGAQQGWPIVGSNWSFYGGGRSGGSSSYSGSYYPSYYSGPVVPYGGYPYAARSAGYYNGAYANGGMSWPNYSYGSYSPSQENVARIRLVVPADAQVWFGNEATKQRGEVREFASPALVPGREYFYGVTVRWRNKDGQEVTTTRQLSVWANSTASADFTRQ
jgi:uncharacterized protein (TIGR03000 family)